MRPYVIFINEGIVNSVTPHGDSEEAEKHFKEEVRKLNDNISDEDLESYIEDGYYQPDYDQTLSINLVWI